MLGNVVSEQQCSYPLQSLPMVTKAELTKQLLAEQEENQFLRRQCSKLVKDREEAEQELFKAESVLRELKRRWKLHQKHFPEACQDVYTVGYNTGKIVHEVVLPKVREVSKPVFSKAMASLTLARGFTK